MAADPTRPLALALATPAAVWTSIARCSHLQKKANMSLDRGEGNQRGKKWKEEINPNPRGRRERKAHQRLQPALLLAGGRVAALGRAGAWSGGAGACECVRAVRLCEGVPVRAWGGYGLGHGRGLQAEVFRGLGRAPKRIDTRPAHVSIYLRFFFDTPRVRILAKSERLTAACVSFHPVNIKKSRKCKIL